MLKKGKTRSDVTQPVDKPEKKAAEKEVEKVSDLAKPVEKVVPAPEPAPAPITPASPDPKPNVQPKNALKQKKPGKIENFYCNSDNSELLEKVMSETGSKKSQVINHILALGFEKYYE